MALSMTVTDVLNTWDQYGVFSYVIPFLIIFAVVFGILQKSKIFGTEEKAKGINAILGLAIGLAALQFDFVSTFFATIFPRFGVGIAILLIFIFSSTPTWQWLMNFKSEWFTKIVSSIRYPSVIQGLAIPLILGLAMVGFEKVHNSNWPKLTLSWIKSDQALNTFKLPLKWIVLTILIFINTL